jgi:CheY-like chemotaxis protein
MGDTQVRETDGPGRDGPGRAGRVLVVDDEPNICALLSATLRLTGFEVRIATGGHDALVAAEEYQPDIVVLDVMLPDLDGFQVAQRLRSSGFPVPVLFLTARDSVEDRISGLTVGGDDYVIKPFSASAPSCAGAGVRWRSPTTGSSVTPTSNWTRMPTRCGGAESSSSCRRPSSTCSATCSPTPVEW